MQVKTHHETEAIVLRTYDYGDYDRVVRLFTRHFGKIAGMAKGARNSRRRFPGTLEPWCLSRVSFIQTTPEKLVFLERCEPIDYFSELRRDPVKTMYAARIGEMVDTFSPERKKNEELFDTFSCFLSMLNEKGAEEASLIGFEMRVLACVGYAPALDRCLSCQKGVEEGKSFFFVAEVGGIKCDQCISPRDSSPIRVNRGTIKALLFTITCPIDKIGRMRLTFRSLKEGRLLVDTFIRHLLGRNLRTARVLEQMEPR
ncbi:MAG: DNA repair protein RecO [Syntrophales bacterium]|nr:DNA repair protein RecO [Syntrophales bacterium]